MKFVVSALLAGWLLAGTLSAAEEDPRGIDFFEKKIRPVLVASCYQCHSASAKKVEGDLRLDTKEGIRKGGENGASIIPGDVGQSLLIKALRHEDGLEMPPNKDPLPEDVIADFVKWVQMGAPDPRKGNASTVGGKINIAEARQFWSFQPPKIVPPAAAKNSAWGKSEIDRYLLAGWESKGLSPVGDADRRTLVRRVYFDLIGLPPTPEAIDSFVADNDPKSLAKLIDKLLASPQFGERWGRHWLDLARYGESTSKERNIPYPYAWRYRDYVYDAVATDKPYDQFIREQIAGDLLPAASVAERNAMITATGFLAIGTKSLNNRIAEQYRMDVADEQLDVATRAVMALSVACARCHDHKFDPIPTTDYYALAGIFRSTEVLAGVKQGNNRTGYAGDYVYLSAEPSASQPELSTADQERLANLKANLADAEEQLQRIQSAAKSAAGQPAKPVDPKVARRLEQLKKKGNVTNKVYRTEAQAYAVMADLKKEITDLEASASAKGDAVMGVRDERQPENCRVNIRGEVSDLGPEVPRGFVRVLTYAQSPEVNLQQSGRLELAQWLSSKQNPLTARVMANRVWFHLFGRGLVGTVDNFGALGERPENQPLLDYLAVKFMADDWSLKSLIREIMLSRAYQLASDHSEAGYAIDPDNKFFWRMNRRRLEAEAIRDSLLAVSGQLDLARPVGSLTQTITGGEIGRQAKTDGLLKPVNYRSAYLPIVRGLMPEFLNLFDVADSELVVGQRDITTVAPQALYLMNNPLVVEQAQATAQRILGNSELADDAARVDYAFRLMLGRPVAGDQQPTVLAYLQDHQLSLPGTMNDNEKRLAAWSSFCQMLMASAEFRYVY